MKRCCITTVRRAWGKLTKKLDNLSDEEIAKQSRTCPICGTVITLIVEEDRQ